MTNQARRPHLITALPTPFTADGALDLEGTQTLFTDVASRPIDGAFIAGTTGEFTALEFDERVEVMRIGLEAFGPERAYQHVGAATTRQAVALTRAAVQLGSRKLAAITPYYFPAPTQAVVDYFAELVRAASGAEVFAYLFEARTTTHCTPEILPLLAEVGITGVKLSGESDESVAAFLAAAPEGFTVFSGNDVSFEALIRAGGDGVISGVSSVFPTPFLQLRDALAAGQTEGTAELADTIRELVAVVKAGEIDYLKGGLEARGMPAGPVRVGVAQLPDDDRAAIAAAVAKWPA